MTYRKKITKAAALALALITACSSTSIDTEAAFNSKASYYNAGVMLQILNNVRAKHGDDYDFSGICSSSEKIMQFVESAVLFDYQWAAYRTTPADPSDGLLLYSIPYDHFVELLRTYFYTIPESLTDDIWELEYLTSQDKVELAVYKSDAALTPGYNVSGIQVYSYNGVRDLYYFTGTSNADGTSLSDSVYLINSNGYNKLVDFDHNEALPAGGELIENEVTKYDDMWGTEWYYGSAGFAINEGIIKGLTANLWGPANTLSRAQFATMLYRMEKEPDATFTEKFPDIWEGTWYTSPVIWASNAGIVTGYENGNFGPADAITREQLAVMLYRYAKSKNFRTALQTADGLTGVIDTETFLQAFPDGDQVSPFAKDAIAWAVNYGIITGKEKEGAKYLSPQSTAVRAECSMMLQRFFNMYGAM